MPPARGRSAALKRLLDGQEQLKLAGDLGEGGATALAQAIACNNSLMDMYLWQTHLKAAGVTAIAEALVGNTSVKNLTIGEDSLTDHHSAFAYGANDIGPEGGKVLATLLRGNDTLELLNVWGVGLGEFGAAHFADALDPTREGHNTRLEWLGIEKNEIGSTGCTALSRCLERNCSLVRLGLEGNFVGDEGIAALSNALLSNTRLKRLNLNANDITEEGIKSLVAAMRKNKTLSWLGLDCNEVGEIGSRELANFLSSQDSANLTRLHLIDANVGNAGARLLAEALKGQQHLNWLLIGANSISNDGLTAMADMLRENSALAVLEVDTQPSGQEEQLMVPFEKACLLGVRAIGEALRDVPRPRGFELEGLHLHIVGAELGLPQVAVKKKWDNRKILDFFWSHHAAKLIAFHMGMHPRLSCKGSGRKASPFALLAGMRDCLELISSSYWGGHPPCLDDVGVPLLQKRDAGGT